PGDGPGQRPGRTRPAGAGTIPPAAHRLRVPGLQPVLRAERAGAGGAAAGLSWPGAQGIPLSRRAVAGRGGPAAPHAPAPGRTVGRREAAGGHSPRPGQATRSAVCRRADQLAGRGQRPDGDRHPAPHRPHPRHHRTLRQPRPAPDPPRRPRAGDGRRPHTERHAAGKPGRTVGRIHSMNATLYPSRLALVAALALLVGCSQPAPPAADAVEPAYAAVARGRIAVEGGLLQLEAPRAGTLDSVSVHEGDRVAKGDTLATLDPEPARLQLQAARPSSSRPRPRPGCSATSWPLRASRPSA